jgi:hypothetical protein
MMGNSEVMGRRMARSPDVGNCINAGSDRITRNPKSIHYVPESAPEHLI